MLGFAFHFCVLASYYLVRPLRDALGLEGGADKLQWLFTATFVVMLLMVPLFGALVSRLPATRFVPLIYRVIAVSMLVFGVLIANHVAPVAVGRVFFVWISIYNLFIVSIFWSVLVDRFSSEQGRRLFGFIAAGGTLGTFIGPLLAATMATRSGPGGVDRRRGAAAGSRGALLSGAAVPDANRNPAVACWMIGAWAAACSPASP